MLLTHTTTQLKIIIRYSNLVVGGVLSSLNIALVLVILYPKNALVQASFPLFIVFFASLLTGGLFANLFCEKQEEVYSYVLAPWSLHSVIVSKNYALAGLSVLLTFFILFVISIFIQSSLESYVNAVLYFITSIPVYILLGNIVSVSQRALSSIKPPTLLQWLIVAASPIPYVIFKSWLDSNLLCILFLGLAILIWYRYELPILEEKFQTNFHKSNLL